MMSSESASPFIKLQKTIDRPLRRASPKRAIIPIFQFVQSDEFQDTFTDLIQSLDAFYRQRRAQVN